MLIAPPAPRRLARAPKSRAALKGALLAGLSLGLAACSGSSDDGAAPTAQTPPVSGGGAGGSGSTPTPPTPPAKVSPSKPEAARFLSRMTFGPADDEIDALDDGTLDDWFLSELDKPATSFLAPLVAAEADGVDLRNNAATNAFWEAAVLADDQLRMRMVYALSQILVVSAVGDLSNEPLSLAYYMDVLSNNAFGNYRDLLTDVTYSPAMGEYLTYLRNRKANPDRGRVPDENYARELMQLFTIGLLELNPDGTVAPGDVETYDNDDVIGLAKVFTGLSHQGDFFSERRADDDGLYKPMAMYPEEHSEDEKAFLNTVIPAGTPGDESIRIALDALFEHPNVPPFISRQLIQRFITSNPTPAYVQRVATAFANGRFELPGGDVVGDGRRGDLAATLAAIHFDPDALARPDDMPLNFGKVREPVIRFTHWARAFKVADAEASPFVLEDASRVDRLGQQAFRSPSVFNFYRPQFVAPATESAEAGLVAPELQIVNEASVVGYANFMSRFIRDQHGRRSSGSQDSYKPDYSEELLLAGSPESLADRLDLVLLNGEMSAETRDRIVRLLREVQIRVDREDEDRLDRVELAVLLTVTSPEFLVQR